MRPDQIAESALAGAGDCAVTAIVTHTSHVDVRWADSALTTNGSTEGLDLDIVAQAPHGGTVTVSGRPASTGEVAELAARAVAGARAAAADTDVPDLPAGGESADWSQPTATTSPDVMVPLARDLGPHFADRDMRHFGYAEHEITTTWLATTAGTRRRHTQRQGRVEFTAKDPAGRRSAWSGHAPVDLHLPVEHVVAGLRADLVHQGTRIDVPAGRRRVILAPSAVADLMIDLYWSADARSAMDGRSVFAGPQGPALGRHLGAPVTLSSDPADARVGMACAAFECVGASSDSASVADNGLALRRTEWIADGTLAHLVCPRSDAASLGVTATPGIDNLALSVTGGTGTTADVVARTDDALLITCLWYNRVVDPQTLLLTGLTRDGVYVVRDGHVVGAAGNFRFNESPVSLLRRIVDAGTPQRTLAREMGDYFNRAVMPPLVVEEFNLSTASEAL